MYSSGHIASLRNAYCYTILFLCLSYLHFRDRKTISRVACVTREECDKTRKAVAEDNIPISKMAVQTEGGLPTEFELALANINLRKQVQKELKDIKRDAVSNDPVLATTGGNVKNKKEVAKRMLRQNIKKGRLAIA